jgi:hypothetical protein
MSVDSGQPQAERRGAAHRRHGRGVAQVAPRSSRVALEDRWRIAGGCERPAPPCGHAGSAAVWRSSASLVRLSARNTLGSVMLLPAWDCLAGRCCPYPLEPGDGGYRGMPTSHPGQAAEPTKSALLCDGRGRPEAARWPALKV